jgi:hypothetical protein
MPGYQPQEISRFLVLRPDPQAPRDGRWQFAVPMPFYDAFQNFTGRSAGSEHMLSERASAHQGDISAR